MTKVPKNPAIKQSKSMRVLSCDYCGASVTMHVPPNEEDWPQHRCKLTGKAGRFTTVSDLVQVAVWKDDPSG